ncbi:MAG: DnaB-like helicase C-terminal domain-containing protein [Bacteroidales bacterium]|nr:DnaB-like helicase C-terminal domain-containing protein [Bacteroidales bacterium]
MQDNNAKDFNGDFERLEKRWNELSKEEKTPAYFATLFSKGFQNIEELKAVQGDIEKLIAGQDWKEGDKKKIIAEIRFIIDPDLKKSFSPYTVGAFIKDIKSFDPSKEYRPTGMSKIIFQHGTFNLIAARPSRGKTSLAVSLMMDAIKNMERFKTPVIFLSFEESNKQIYTRIFNNLLFATAKNAKAEKLIAAEHPNWKLWETLKDPQNPDYKDRAYYVESVKEKVLELEASTRLQVVDFSGKDINAIENFLAFNENALVFIDYVQLIRPDPNKPNFNTLDGYNDISKRLVDAAKANNQIIVALAQLRRDKEGADSDNPESLNDTQLKDCGQFEQDANTIIALGRNTAYKDKDQAEHDKGEPLYFWKLLKNRDGGGVNKSYLFDTSNLSIGFSFLHSTETDAAFLNKAETQNDKQRRLLKNGNFR